MSASPLNRIVPQFKLRLVLCAIIALRILTSSLAAQSPIAIPPGPPRPDAASGPTKISVAMWVSDISKIDSVAQTFSASVVLYLRWRDSRLAHNEAGIKQYKLDEIWHPLWVIANEAGSLDRAVPDTVNVTAGGEAIYRQRIAGSFAQALDLRKFPFDRDTFRIHLLVTGYRPDEINFVPDEMAIAAGIPNGAAIAPDITLQDWRVLSSSVRTLPYRAAPGLEVAGYAFEFTAARHSNHFVIKVIIPLILIVMMSWAVFWVEPTDTGSQLGTAVTAMLTLIAYRFALDTEVPKLPYVTRLDSFVLVSTLLVFLSLIEVIATTRFAHNGRIPLARRIDRISRWAFPAAFTIVSAIIFLR
jgi:hypothetical protein